jgi:hypothetical protein
VKVPLHAGPGLLLGLPTLGRPVNLDWAFAFKSLNPPINFNTVFHIVVGKPVADARNEMAQAAIDKNCKYLFFLGDDTIVPNHTLRQLIYRMEQDPDVGVVGGVYCAKADPAYPLVFRGQGNGSYWDWKIGEYFEVTGLGMDCTLIRTDVFRDMKPDWFATISSDKYLDGVNDAEEWTEDLFFLARVKEETGWKIMCDANVICGHHDISTGRTYTLPMDSLPRRQKVMTIADKKALLVNGKDIKLSDGAEFSVTTFGPTGSDFRGHYTSLPFDADYFDWVIIEGIKEVSDAMVTEAYRVCKRGGKVTLNHAFYINVETVKEHYSRIAIHGKIVNSYNLEIQKPEQAD